MCGRQFFRVVVFLGLGAMVTGVAVGGAKLAKEKMGEGEYNEINW